ncbi:MAG TPA: polysaccharide biosynthesis C-terminal domain-containing protein, partial [Clostridia bacterium]|nr:polysaccharide biosynthesis C-terminal domain-containing protein [Clostridia bacterium]
AYSGYLQGMQQMTGTAVSQIAEQLFKLAAGFALAKLLLKYGPEYAAMGALIGVSISELFALIIIFVFYIRRRQRFIEPQSTQKFQTSSLPISRQILMIAVPVTIGASVMPLTGILDSALIIRTLEGIGYSVEAAGEAYSLLYSYVTRVINMPAVLTVALAMSLVPAISSYTAKKEFRLVKSAALTGMKLALIIGTPCAVGLYVLAEPILGMLYSSLTKVQLSVASDLMRTACVGVVFLSLVQALTGVIQGLGKPYVPVINLVFGGFLKVVTLLVLMRRPEINIQGAAVSTVVCYGTAGILDIVYLVRKTGLRLNIFDVFIKPIASSALMGLAVYALYAFLIAHISPTLATLIAVMLGVALYAAAFIGLRMLNTEDLAFIPGGSRLKALMGQPKRKR